MPPVEVEVAFMICAADPVSVAGAVASLSEAGGLTLRPRAARRMRDIHFDMPDRRLAARGYILRIRWLASGDQLTLKGEARQSDWAGIERLEIEGPWSRATYDEVLQALHHAGIELPGKRVNIDSTDHVGALAAAGFQLIQDRETERTIRDCLNDAGHVAAELSIDDVSVHLTGEVARFMQVEIEGKAGRDSAALSRIVADLHSRFGDVLRRWPYGKLATGLALADEAAEGRLREVCDADQRVTPRGCDALETRLRRSDSLSGSASSSDKSSSN